MFCGTISRRHFFARAGGLSVLPIIDSLSGGCRPLSPSSARTPASSRLFSANAGVLGAIGPLASVAEAVIHLLEYFGVKPNFGHAVQFAGGSSDVFQQCLPLLRELECRDFCGVGMSRFDSRIQVLAAASAVGRFRLSMSYLARRPVTLDETGLMVVTRAAENMRSRLNLDGRSIARAITITEVAYGTVDGFSICSYRNSLGGSIIHRIDRNSGIGDIAIKVAG